MTRSLIPRCLRVQDVVLGPEFATETPAQCQQNQPQPSRQDAPQMQAADRHGVPP